MNEAHYPTQAKIEESLRLCIIALLLSLVPKLCDFLANVIELMYTLQIPLLESVFRLIPKQPFFFFLNMGLFIYGASALLFALAAWLLQEETSPSRTKTLLQVALISFILLGLLILGRLFIPLVLYGIHNFFLPSILYVVAYGSFCQAYTELSGQGGIIKVGVFGALIWEVSAVRIFMMLPYISGMMTPRYLVIASATFSGLVVNIFLLGLFLTHSSNKTPKKNTPPVTPQEDLQDSLKDLLKKK